MSENEAMRFVRELAVELTAGEVRLPSLPDVVVRIRKLLEKEDCDFEQVAQACSTDPVLVSRLLVFANSAAYNTNGETVTSIEDAIRRLGFTLVRDTAVTLAMKQLFLGEQHKEVVGHIRELWASSMQLSALAHSIARRNKSVDAETAFLCGLVNGVGKLYILTKARGFPQLLGNDTALTQTIEEWHAKIGKSILEAWSFPADVCESIDPSEHMSEHTHLAPTQADVVFLANRILRAESDGAPHLESMPSSVRLGIDEAVLQDVLADYQNKLKTVQQTLAKAA